MPVHQVYGRAYPWQVELYTPGEWDALDRYARDLAAAEQNRGEVG